MELTRLLVSAVVGISALFASFLPQILFLLNKKHLRKKLGKDYKTLDITIIVKKHLMVIYVVAAALAFAQYFFLHSVSVLLFWLVWLTVTYFVSGMGLQKVFYNNEYFALSDTVKSTGLNIIKWSDLESIEWDRDFGQAEWGVKIFIKGMDHPLRYYFRRKDKEKVDGFFSSKI
jgi:hypothetical protein